MGNDTSSSKKKLEEMERILDECKTLPLWLIEEIQNIFNRKWHERKDGYINFSG